MLEERESSLLFSLKELTNFEDERQRREVEAAREKVERELAAQRANEERVRLEEQARRAKEEQRAARERQREREEAARFESARAAEIERVRWEHEERLARLANDAKMRRLRRLFRVAVGAFLVVSAAQTSVFLFKLRGARAEEEARVLSLAEEGRLREASWKREVDALTKRVRDGERQNGELRARPPQPTEAGEVPHARHEPHHGQVRPIAPPANAKKCDCDARDPLCGCLY